MLLLFSSVLGAFVIKKNDFVFYELCIFVIFPSLVLLLLLANRFNYYNSIFSDLSFNIYVWHDFLLKLLITFKRANIINVSSFFSMIVFTSLTIIYCYFVLLATKKISILSK